MRLVLLTFLVHFLLTANCLAESAGQLGKDLTPNGAIQSGNKDGTIPAWTGGITTPPAGYKEGTHHVDPFADDKSLFTIKAGNASKYAGKLSEGQLAMLKRYPDSWSMPVYPTRRSASLPQHVYDATIQNSSTAKLSEDGNGVLDASIGVPFPVPSNGLQVIWNHLLRYRGESVHRIIGQVAPTASGAYTFVRIDEKAIWPYAKRGSSIDTIGNRLAYFLQEVQSPARLAGRILLVHETLNQTREPRKAWTYNPGQRRVRRAPNVAYDNPGTASDSQRTNDQLDMFNGSPDRYNWKLVGRQELYVPYNSYKVQSDSLSYEDIVIPGHPNPEHLRYELHRVWKVEATVKDGTSHIYAKRVFYLDEDSWQVLVVDQYDKRGQIWRLSEAHTINYYEMPFLWDTLQAHYDLQNGRYLLFGLNNEDKIDKFNLDFTLQDFTPEALRRSGLR